MIRLDSLASGLRDHGFDRTAEDVVSRDVVFERKSHLAALFERIWLTFGGRRGESVAVFVGVSVVPGLSATKGLIDLEVLAELADDPHRGWATLKSRAAAAVWQSRLVEIAPQRATDLAMRCGPGLLDRTARVRSATAQYINKLDLILNGRVQINEAIAAEAIRIARAPGVQQHDGAIEAYKMAAEVILVFGPEVDGRDFIGMNPVAEPELMWRLQLLTASLLERISIPGA